MTPSQTRRRAAKQRLRPPGSYYAVDSYRRAINRACDLAFPPAKELEGEDLAAWRRSQRCSPNQLRHSAAMEIRQEFGLEAAQVVLGHSKADVAQVYAERDYTLAASVAAKIG